MCLYVCGSMYVTASVFINFNWALYLDPNFCISYIDIYIPNWVRKYKRLSFNTLTYFILNLLFRTSTYDPLILSWLCIFVFVGVYIGCYQFIPPDHSIILIRKWWSTLINKTIKGSLPPVTFANTHMYKAWIQDYHI